ncbi:hypothetical protein [Frankia sp. Cas3]|uniref:hypothetical protein n=1 Tax=Frankia sp. Cas3 TaxID=3073926 RepID=UPI002AD4821E|nr:hypothetical protein [Frankia sp. Cas3]
MSPRSAPYRPRPTWGRLAAAGRALGRLLRAGIALVALVALVGGLPWGLWHFIGWPLPDRLTPAKTHTDRYQPARGRRVGVSLPTFRWIFGSAALGELPHPLPIQHARNGRPAQPPSSTRFSGGLCR